MGPIRGTFPLGVSSGSSRLKWLHMHHPLSLFSISIFIVSLAYFWGNNESHYFKGKYGVWSHFTWNSETNCGGDVILGRIRELLRRPWIIDGLLGLCDSSHGDLTGIRGLDALISGLGRQLSVAVDIDFTVLNLCNTTNLVLRRIFLFSKLISTLTDRLTKDSEHFFIQWHRCCLSLFTVGPHQSRTTKYGTWGKCSITFQIFRGCTAWQRFLNQHGVEICIFEI